MPTFKIQCRYSPMKLVALFIIIYLSSTLYAEESTKEESPWNGDVQFGYVMSSGNTESENLNGKISVEYKSTDWLQAAKLEAFSSSDQEITTAERYKFEYQANKNLEDNSYLFVNTTYENDRFSGFDYRATLSGGYGFRYYEANDMTLDTEFGLGYRYSVTDIDPISNESMDDSESLVRAAAKYKWQIGENRSLISDLTIEAGEETTITNFEVGFVTMIAGDLSLKVGYAARHTSEVPADKEKLDTVTSINLLYAF